MKRLEFHISYLCKNNCIFCSERSALERTTCDFVCLETVRDELRRHSKLGFNHVTFTGGEPSLHPQITDILEFAKEFGFKIFMTTNGGYFSRSQFCKQNLLNIDEISFSVHGHNASTHNKLTQNISSFSDLSLALKNIESSDSDLTAFANIVLLPQNLELIERILSFISRFKKIKQVLLSNLAPEGRALDHYVELAIPLRTIQKAIPKIIRCAEKLSLAVKFFGVPLCVLGEFGSYSNDLYWTPRKTLEQISKRSTVRIKETISCKPIRNRTKTAVCSVCSQKDQCGGIFELYLKTFPGHEFPKPF